MLYAYIKTDISYYLRVIENFVHSYYLELRITFWNNLHIFYLYEFRNNQAMYKECNVCVCVGGIKWGKSIGPKMIVPDRSIRNALSPWDY